MLGIVVVFFPIFVFVPIVTAIYFVFTGLVVLPFVEPVFSLFVELIFVPIVAAIHFIFVPIVTAIHFIFVELVFLTFVKLIFLPFMEFVIIFIAISVLFFIEFILIFVPIVTAVYFIFVILVFHLFVKLVFVLFIVFLPIVTEFIIIFIAVSVIFFIVFLPIITAIYFIFVLFIGFVFPLVMFLATPRSKIGRTGVLSRILTGLDVRLHVFRTRVLQRRSEGGVRVRPVFRAEHLPPPGGAREHAVVVFSSEKGNARVLRGLHHVPPVPVVNDEELAPLVLLRPRQRKIDGVGRGPVRVRPQRRKVVVGQVLGCADAHVRGRRLGFRRLGVQHLVPDRARHPARSGVRHLQHLLHPLHDLR
mmetsp:Transcript_183/g.454  ORF Transcript_183/g.454 Transcript_183/m.454 type:complete len:361 (+) Transcript_183:516-1598(+)